MFLFALFQLSAQLTTVIPQSFMPGNAPVAYTESWTPLHNPAPLANENHFGVALLYENKYLTPELSNQLIAAILPTPYFNIGLTYAHFGYAVYNEMMAAITLSRRFGRFSLGIECDYFTMFLSEADGYRGTVTAQAGVQVDLTRTLTLGVNIFNPVFSKIKTEPHTRLPVALSVGTSYKFYPTFNWLVQIEKESSSPIRIATGLWYEPIEQLAVAIGVSVATQAAPNLVVSVTLGGFQFHVQSAYYYPLGFVLSGMLSYRFL